MKNLNSSKLISTVLVICSFAFGYFVIGNPRIVQPVVKVIAQAIALGYGSCPYGSGEYGNLNCNNAVTSTSLNLKVLLSGNFVDSSDTMTTSLQLANIIPTAQPYSAAPYLYSGTESATAFATDVVDWVLVEVKNSTGATVAKKAGLLKSNGSVVDSTASATTLSLPSVTTTGDYKVIVRHRNHLAIATDSNATLTTNAISTIDLTQNINVRGQNQLKVGTNSSSQDLYAMRMANISSDDTVDSLDRTLSKNAVESLNVYDKADVNLDGTVDSLDRTLSSLAQEALENI